MPSQTMKNKISAADIHDFREKLLAWYDQSGRELPWRYKEGEVPDPYFVWLSEIMLQQTTVTAVLPYYLKFIETWTTVNHLASAPREDVMAAWAGLGYYSRARNLHACAQVVAFDLGGVFPQDQVGLKALPGIGDYTSAAIRTIAFNQPATVIDGNIERIMARLFEVTEALPAAKKTLKSYAALFFDGFEDRPGDFAQSLMDLGSVICTPKSPKCLLCPVSDHCGAYHNSDPAQFPVRVKKKRKPHRKGFVYWVTNEAGEVLLHTRPDKGLLAGMIALPTSEWGEGTPDPLAFLGGIEFQRLNDVVNHVFTHFSLELILKRMHVSERLAVPEGYFWVHPDQIENLGFPSVFQKAVNLFFE